MDLHQIRNYLIYGVEDDEDKITLYEDALKKGCDPINRRIDALCQDKKERDEANDDLSQALIAYENVYMELGMKAGARLIQQLLFVDDPMEQKDNSGAAAAAYRLNRI